MLYSTKITSKNKIKSIFASYHLDDFSLESYQLFFDLYNDTDITLNKDLVCEICNNYYEILPINVIHCYHLDINISNPDLLIWLNLHTYAALLYNGNFLIKSFTTNIH